MFHRKPIYATEISGRFDVGSLQSYIICDDHFRNREGKKVSSPDWWLLPFTMFFSVQAVFTFCHISIFWVMKLLIKNLGYARQTVTVEGGMCHRRSRWQPCWWLMLSELCYNCSMTSHKSYIPTYNCHFELCIMLYHTPLRPELIENKTKCTNAPPAWHTFWWLDGMFARQQVMWWIHILIIKKFDSIILITHDEMTGLCLWSLAAFGRWLLNTSTLLLAI